MRRALAATVLAASGLGSWAAEPEATRPSAEPRVQRIVVEDANARIEELRVRGQTQRIVVHPKRGGKDYEIVTGDASRDLTAGHGTTRGAAGQRVWNVLSF